MFGLGVPELLLILLVVLIFFGADKIPQLAKSLGKGLSEFKKAQQEFKDEITKEVESSDSTPLESKEIPSPYQTICPACHNKVSKDSAFCSYCGQRVLSQPLCTTCQRSFLPDEKFCPGCGQARPS